MQEIIIHNWDELQRAVFDDVWDEKIMRYRDNRIYRGMADESWNLVPSLNRVCGHDLSLETQVFRSFRKYGYAELAEYSGFWKLLPVALHHGLPTRLLDWTYSPLVAAHFATEDTSCYDCDGVIWCLDVTDFRKYMPAPLLRKLVDTGSNIFTVGMLEKVIPDFEKMREMSDKPYAIFFEPSSMIDRIVNQYALFSVVSDPAVLLSDILGTDEDVVSRDIENEAEREMLLAAVSELGPREQEIMQMRFGLCGGKERTQKEVAEAIGISQSYISRLEKKIIRKLRKKLEEADQPLTHTASK